MKKIHSNTAHVSVLWHDLHRLSERTTRMIKERAARLAGKLMHDTRKPGIFDNQPQVTNRWRQVITFVTDVSFLVFSCFLSVAMVISDTGRLVSKRKLPDEPTRGFLKKRVFWYLKWIGPAKKNMGNQ